MLLILNLQQSFLRVTVGDWLAFTTWHRELKLKTNHLGPLPVERRLEPGVCPHPGVPLEIQFTLPEVFSLLLLGSPASGTEQQLWQCAPPLAGNHDEGFRVSQDAQRYVAFKSHVMLFFKAWEFPRERQWEQSWGWERKDQPCPKFQYWYIALGKGCVWHHLCNKVPLPCLHTCLYKFSQTSILERPGQKY